MLGQDDNIEVGLGAFDATMRALVRVDPREYEAEKRHYERKKAAQPKRRGRPKKKD